MIDRLTALRQVFAPGEIVRPVLTVLIVGVASWAVLAGLDLPEWYRTIVGLVLGYWFGSRPNGKSTTSRAT